MRKSLMTPIKILPRNVIIATPSVVNGSLSIFYMDSLVNSIRMSSKYNIALDATYIFNDALIQRTRNDLIQIALEKNVDDIIWINSDLYWKPEWIFKLLNYEYDIVGGTYPQNSDKESYNIKAFGDEIKVDQKTGLFEVEKLGLGFLKVSKRALISLWNNNVSYKMKDKKMAKWIFEVLLEDGRIIREDEIFCRKLTKLGYKIYLDPSITCDRIGPKKYSGDFNQLVKKLIDSGKIKINEY